MDNFPSIADHLFIWAFGIIIPFFSGLQSAKLSGAITFDSSARMRLYLANSVMLGIAGSSILILWAASQRSFETLGFKRVDWQHQEVVIIAMILFTLLYLADILITSKSIKQHPSSSDWIKRYSFLPQYPRELPSYLVLCMSAGLFEEIIYRGFMVAYFTPHNHNNIPWMAILAPAVLFSLAHYYQGWTAVIKITIFSILFGIIFIYSNSLYPTILMHLLVDVISGIFYMHQLNKLRDRSDQH